VINSGDTAWIISATALVLLMTLPALALFYGGLVQAKNILSVLVQCFAIACVASVLWFVCGYSLAFSGSGRWIGDLHAVLLANITRSQVHPGTTIPESVYVMFASSTA
jgi:Amt family ammonium transporter